MEVRTTSFYATPSPILSACLWECQVFLGHNLALALFIFTFNLIVAVFSSSQSTYNTDFKSNQDSIYIWVQGLKFRMNCTSIPILKNIVIVILPYRVGQKYSDKT